MTQPNEMEPDFAEPGEDVQVPEDEVKSAARSCSAIIIIVVIVVMITCVMAGIALFD